jgi:uncharacterized repeat protein (TIGR03806 family)
MVEPRAVNGRRSNRRLVWLLLGAMGAAGAPILVSCSHQPDDTESVQQAATVVARVANTTLQMPSAPGTYKLDTAFPTLPNFTAPIAMATPPGETNRLFVVERAGRIKVIPNLASPGTSTTTFLDISGRVSTSGEEGLLGLAFHPNYASNGFFYVFYSTTATVNGVNKHFERVSRFKVSANANVADGASEQVMIDQADDATNHNGGDLHFGADGYLYISVGDEGQGNDTLLNSQKIDKDFFSGILRIDVDKKAGNLTPNAHVPDPLTKDPSAVKAGTYLVPADNPFVGATSFNGLPVTSSKVRTEFWAVGLRNPFRFSFDGPSGQLWVGDVGQDTREEIDIVQKGKNYGWAYREGKGVNPTLDPKRLPAPAGAMFTDPIFDYATSATEGKAVIGGVVYRGSTLIELSGAYIYGDNTSGNVWSLTQTSPGVYAATKLAQEAGVNAFGVDPRNGDVLVSILGGPVRRLVRNTGGGTLPAKLSQTGAFSDLATLTPNAGIVPYEPNVAFWSDHAIKTRWFSIPDATKKMTFATDSNWTFPTGEVWIKHFDMEMVRGDSSSKRRLETRFLVKTTNGAYGVTYKWNAAQTDADLVADGGLDEQLTITDMGTPITQTWHYPSRTECMVCHTDVGGTALSFNTRQMNGSFTYPPAGSGLGGTDNQLQVLSDAGYFTAAITNIPSLPKVYKFDDASQSVETRARSYLQVNCSQCHQPGGTGLGSWDARMKTALDQAGIINGVLADNRGDPANRVVVPQDPGHSMLLRRIQAAPNAPRMPPLASNVLDQNSINLINDWVLSIAAPTTFAFEAEALTSTSTPAAALQTDGMTSGGQWMLYTPSAVGGTVDYSGINLPAGTYSLKFRYKTNNNRGQLTVKVDGTQVGGTIDQFASPSTYPENTLGNVTFASAGNHVIRLTVTGKNASSTGLSSSADLFTFVSAGPPPSPPPVPTSFTATGGNPQVKLQWTVMGSSQTGFKLDRKVAGTADSTYAMLPNQAASATSFTDASGAANTTYTYRIRAFNAAGDSAALTADIGVTAPPQPASFTATGGVKQATLMWSYVDSGQTGFKLDRKVAGTADSTYVMLPTQGASVRSFTDTDSALTNASYTYRIRATSTGAGDSIEATADAMVTVPPPPAQPQGFTAMGGVGQAVLSWTAGPGDQTGYKLERKVLNALDSTYVLVASPAASATSFTDTPAPGSYTYRLKAFNGSGDSIPSTPADATVAPASVSITNLVVNDNLPAGCVSPNCNKDKWSIKSNIQIGAVVFGDRAYTLDSVDSQGTGVILGGPWISTAADSKNFTGTPLATFKANGTSVFLLVDDRWNGTGTRPPWLTDATFVDTGFNVMIKQNPQTTIFAYSVYRKTVTSGSTVSLPKVGGSTAPAYFIILK